MTKGIITTRRIRERLEENYPKIDWYVRKQYKQPAYIIRGSIYRKKKTKEIVPPERLFEHGVEELMAAQMVTNEVIAMSFVDVIDNIGAAFYADMRRKISE